MFRSAILTSPRPVATLRHQTDRPLRVGTLIQTLLSAAGVNLDAVVILSVAATASFMQARDGYAHGGNLSGFLPLGALVAFLFVLTTLLRGDYKIAKFLARQGLFRRTFTVWATAVIGAFASAFALHIGRDLLPAALFGFCAAGLVATYFARLGLLKAAQPHVKPGGIAERGIFLIGREEEIRLFNKRYEAHLVGTRVIAATILRGRDHLDEDLTLACASARILQPDDVIILVPWSQTETINACIDAFMRLPAAIHLGPDVLLERYADAEIAKVGAVPSLNLVRRPLSPFDIAMKRAMDIALASLGLLLLSPLLVAAAIAIKLDSPGPVIFRQRRYGFNQQPFRIFKFRSMRTLEDDAQLTEVVQGDARVTRFGQFMRRRNIDELPQLINVLIGNMSLVGPRPHALAHDQAFERSIALYARRHNVKPGITGWAQVNGLRGGFSEEMMRARVAHDLYYIDNWSLWFDIKIIWLTLVSKKSYTNAF